MSAIATTEAMIPTEAIVSMPYTPEGIRTRVQDHLAVTLEGNMFIRWYNDMNEGFIRQVGRITAGEELISFTISLGTFLSIAIPIALTFSAMFIPTIIWDFKVTSFVIATACFLFTLFYYVYPCLNDEDFEFLGHSRREFFVQVFALTVQFTWALKNLVDLSLGVFDPPTGIDIFWLSACFQSVIAIAISHHIFNEMETPQLSSRSFFDDIQDFLIVTLLPFLMLTSAMLRIITSRRGSMLYRWNLPIL